MATNQAAGPSVDTKVRRERDDGDDIGDILPRAVASENAMEPDKVSAAWEKVYAAVGAASAGEKDRKAIRAAVYVYGLINGTSRRGSYKGTVTTATGKRFSTSVIQQAVGETRVRQFYRGNMEESYKLLKLMNVGEHFPSVGAKAASLGIAPEDAFAMADWLAECPKFTTSERMAHNLAFNHGIERARRARGGRTLEEVEAEERREELDVQGVFDRGQTSPDNKW